MWPTTDGALVRASLAKIDATAPPVLPVPERVLGAASAATSEAADTGSRQGRRWTDEEDAQLSTGFAEGTPAALLADELGRTRSAIGGRLKAQGLVARVVWRDGVTVPSADKALAYALTEVPPPLRTSVDGVAEALEADEWVTEAHAEALRVTASPTGDPLDAVVAVASADPLLMGEASSRLLVAELDVCPPGVDAVVAPRPR
jgi:hypothetical protein